MEVNIRLLEERVKKAAGRLRELSAERKKLEIELNSLREQLESAAHGGTAGTAEDQADWRARRTDAVAAIRQTLAELRGA